MYNYKATIVKVVDADTIDVDIDLGFYVTARKRLRLARINAWEVRGVEREKGLLAKERVTDLLYKDQPSEDQENVGKIEIVTNKQGKYGRWIAEVIFTGTLKGQNLSNILVNEGHARYVEY